MFQISDYQKFQNTAYPVFPSFSQIQPKLSIIPHAGPLLHPQPSPYPQPTNTSSTQPWPTTCGARGQAISVSRLVISGGRRYKFVASELFRVGSRDKGAGREGNIVVVDCAPPLRQRITTLFPPLPLLPRSMLA